MDAFCLPGLLHRVLCWPLHTAPCLGVARTFPPQHPSLSPPPLAPRARLAVTLGLYGMLRTLQPAGRHDYLIARVELPASAVHKAWQAAEVRRWRGRGRGLGWVFRPGEWCGFAESAAIC